jgi:hypothetical protein
MTNALRTNRYKIDLLFSNSLSGTSSPETMTEKNATYYIQEAIHKKMTTAPEAPWVVLKHDVFSGSSEMEVLERVLVLLDKTGIPYSYSNFIIHIGTASRACTIEIYRNKGKYAKTRSPTSITTSGDITVGNNLNVANVQITDKTITVASTALNSSSTDGAGLVAGAWSSGTKPSILWDHNNSRWVSSKPIAEAKEDVLNELKELMDIQKQELIPIKQELVQKHVQQIEEKLQQEQVQSNTNKKKKKKNKK